MLCFPVFILFRNFVVFSNYLCSIVYACRDVVALLLLRELLFFNVQYIVNCPFFLLVRLQCFHNPLFQHVLFSFPFSLHSAPASQLSLFCPIYLDACCPFIIGQGHPFCLLYTICQMGLLISPFGVVFFLQLLNLRGSTNTSKGIVSCFSFLREDALHYFDCWEFSKSDRGLKHKHPATITMRIKISSESNRAPECCV